MLSISRHRRRYWRNRNLQHVFSYGRCGIHWLAHLSESGFKGYSPVVFDNFSNGHDWAVQWGPTVIGDLLDTDDIRRAFKSYKFCGIIHMAGLSIVSESARKPALYYLNNFVGTMNLVQIMQEFSVNKIVFSSTSAVYGEPNTIPISEEHTLSPSNPYGESKLFIEKMLGSETNANGLNAVALRYFNASGADPQANIGEDHEPETHLIPLVLNAVFDQKGPLMVFGNDYDTPDGTCVRDYIHVCDLADAHIRSLEYLLKDGATTSLNLANGNGYSVMEVIQAVERVTGQSVKYEIGDRRPGDPAILIGDASRAKRVLGWTPKYINLDEHIAHAWAWYKKIGKKRIGFGPNWFGI